MKLLSPRLLLTTILGWASTAPLAAQTVRDSAGIKIVDNPRPRWTSATAWRFGAKPYLTIGLIDWRAGEEAPSPDYEFKWTQDVVVLSDGRFVVADVDEHRLRVFDSTGKYLQSIGRQGNGPGEFPEVGAVFRMPGDTLVIAMMTRVVRFTATGQHVSTKAINEHFLTGPSTFGYFADGGSVAKTYSSWERQKPRSGSWVDSIDIYVKPAKARSPKLIGRFPAVVYSFNEVATTVAFSPSLVLQVSGNRLYVGFGDRFEIRVYTSDGRLERIIRRPWHPTPVGRGDLAAFKKAYFEAPVRGGGGEGGGIAPSGETYRERNYRRLTFAKSLPAFTKMLFDHRGNLWVRHSTFEDYYLETGAGASRWSVFDSAGTWLGEVDVPTAVRVRAFGRNNLVTLDKDRDDVEYFSVYRLIEPQ